MPTFCLPAMPKATPIIPKFHHIARNEITGVREKITPTEETRLKYVNLCKPRPVYKPKNKKVVVTPLTAEEQDEVDREWALEMAARSLQSRITMERRLEERLGDKISEVPLVERLSAPFEYQPAPPIPDDIKFRKTKILKRIEEMKTPLETVKQRFDPLFLALKEEDVRISQGLPERVPIAHRNGCWRVYDRFQEIYDSIEVEGHNWDNKHWRYLKGTLKKFKRIRVENIESRLAEICKQFYEENIRLP